MAAPRKFVVRGPLVVPTDGPSGSRHLDRTSLRSFWAGEASEYADDIGCYVFALRRGGGSTPIYVGRTSRSFKAECFTDRNYRLLHMAMSGQRGTLMLYLVSYVRSRGRVNGRAIGDVERFLVESAIEKNPSLANLVFTKGEPGFMIQGVHRSRGRSSSSARSLKGTLGIV